MDVLEGCSGRNPWDVSVDISMDILMYIYGYIGGWVYRQKFTGRTGSVLCLFAGAPWIQGPPCILCCYRDGSLQRTENICRCGTEFSDAPLQELHSICEVLLTLEDGLVCSEVSLGADLRASCTIKTAVFCKQAYINPGGGQPWNWPP